MSVFPRVEHVRQICKQAVECHTERKDAYHRQTGYQRHRSGLTI